MGPALATADSAPPPVSGSTFEPTVGDVVLVRSGKFDGARGSVARLTDKKAAVRIDGAEHLLAKTQLRPA